MDRRVWPAGVRPRGDGIQIRIWKNGKEIWSEIVPGDPYNARDLKAAVKRRQELISRSRLGLPLDTREKSENQLLVEAAQDYMDNLSVEHSTDLSYENIINRVWLPALGRRILQEITTREIKSTLADLKVSHKTKRNYLIPLRGIFDEFDINPNPARFRLQGKHQKPRVERFLPEERDLILKQLDGEALVYFALMFGTGMRPSEILALTWADYDGTGLEVSKTIVRRKHKPTTKNHEIRTVYVPTWVRAHLKAHQTRFEGSFIFLNSKGGPHLDSDRFNEAWQAAFDTHALKRKHRIKYRIPYTCRHTRAAELLSTGVDPGDAAAQLGHTLEMFYRTYSEWIAEYAGKSDLSRFEGYKMTNAS